MCSNLDKALGSKIQLHEEEALISIYPCDGWMLVNLYGGEWKLLVTIHRSN